MTLGKAADSGDQMLYQREIFINPSRTYQWISVRLFTLRHDVDDDTALALLIAHLCYRDAYAAAAGRLFRTPPRPWGVPSKNRAGCGPLLIRCPPGGGGA